MADWNVVVSATIAGTPVAWAEGRGLRLTRRLNNYSEVSFTEETLSDLSPHLLIATRSVKVYRDTVLRFHGRIHDPLEATSQTISPVAKDPFADLWNRRIRTEADATFASTDAGAIAWELINDQNGYRTTRIQSGTIQTSVNRVRNYDVGKPIAEAIIQLAEVNQGFYFRIDPVDGVAGTLGQFEVRYPASGNTEDDVRFEFGSETLENCIDYKVTTVMPRNRVRITGGNGLFSVAEDAASILIYDLWEDELSYSDVTEQATLDQIALMELRPNPTKIYEITPGPESPVLFRDFDVGDLVRYKILHGPDNVAGQARVVEATVSVSDNGLETLEGLILQGV